ncbi:MAG: 3-methyl-2-oxobutanoate hydroxymethyltransferase [Proteobacteria bacterium]|nr:3-methyl-2-oxobutanoate hydroxymethyltransferase [Pseudomonadota bacterium]NIS71653.1 3-methyl-2-oxobutanoate hydroxymethyltransferase [Pseudomonadota bacterium]
MEREKITIPDILEKRRQGQKITMLTAYDYPTALLVDRAGIDMILVGDSLGMVVLGYETTVPVTMDEMIHHTKAVVRGARFAMVVGDMPFMSYNTSEQDAIVNAGRFIKEGGADAVKLEGGTTVQNIVEAIARAGIPVMGHIGLTPQTISQLGGFKVQGRSAGAAKKIIEDAKALEDAGAFSLVLEAIPAEIAERITGNVRIPTIGIGAGISCDGQVLVYQDMVGLFDRFVPKFVKQYSQVGEIMLHSFKQFKEEVEKGVFPGEEHSFRMGQKELKKI